MKQISEKKIDFFFNVILPIYGFFTLVLAWVNIKASQYYLLIGGLLMIALSLYSLLSKKINYISKTKKIVLLFIGIFATIVSFCFI